jgi:hypothetical protein
VRTTFPTALPWLEQRIGRRRCRCLMNDAATPMVTFILFDEQQTVVCGDRYTSESPACASCSVGYFRRFGDCVKCSPPAPRGFIVLGVAFFVYCTVLLTAHRARDRFRDEMWPALRRLVSVMLWIVIAVQPFAIVRHLSGVALHSICCSESIMSL